MNPGIHSLAPRYFSEPRKEAAGDQALTQRHRLGVRPRSGRAGDGVALVPDPGGALACSAQDVKTPSPASIPPTIVSSACG